MHMHHVHEFASSIAFCVKGEIEITCIVSPPAVTRNLHCRKKIKNNRFNKKLLIFLLGAKQTLSTMARSQQY